MRACAAIVAGLVLAAPEARGDPGGPQAPGRPEVVLGRPVVLGSLDKEIVLRIARVHLDELRACFERLVARAPAHEGGAGRIDFTIDSSGHVRDAAYAAGPTSAGVDRCLLAAVERWRFPGGPGLSRLQLPFTLRRGGDEEAIEATRVEAPVGATPAPVEATPGGAATRAAVAGPPVSQSAGEPGTAPAEIRGCGCRGGTMHAGWGMLLLLLRRRRAGGRPSDARAGRSRSLLPRR